MIDKCDAAIAAWDRKEAPKRASQFYRIIERAGGRCQACGIPGSIRPIDVDHIQPQASSRNGMVTLPDGTRVPLDDERNLQALCTRCNRGKRDTSTYGFRPSADRLHETIVLVLQQAQSQGYDWESVLADARAELTEQHEAIASRPHAWRAGPLAGQSSDPGYGQGGTQDEHG